MDIDDKITNELLNTYAFVFAVYVWESAQKIQEDEDPPEHHLEEIKDTLEKIIKKSENNIRLLPQFLVYFILQFSEIALDSAKTGDYLSIFETTNN